MRELGISIYPEHSTIEKDMAYIKLAHQYGFTKIFTCLLSVNGDKEGILQEFKTIISYAKSLNFEVTLDISPRVFDSLEISYHDLSFFNNMGADAIRLDQGFTGQEEALMTYNPFGLKIEINMSSATKYLDNLLSYQPDLSHLTGCHNFYPHRYAALSYPFFIECSKKFKAHGLRTAAFVNSQDATFGPWPIMEGLPTLEMHRKLPIQVQAQHLFMTQLIDVVIIGNAYASEKELSRLSQVNASMPTFEVELYDTISSIERKIVLEEPHFYRGDVSDYFIRSTQSRVKYKMEEFPPTNVSEIQRGDILIENERYGQYKGELQIALMDMENSGKTNVVGHVSEDMLFLIDYLKPWQNFQFKIKE